MHVQVLTGAGNGIGSPGAGAAVTVEERLKETIIYYSANDWVEYDPRVQIGLLETIVVPRYHYTGLLVTMFSVIRYSMTIRNLPLNKFCRILFQWLSDHSVAEACQHREHAGATYRLVDLFGWKWCFTSFALQTPYRRSSRNNRHPGIQCTHVCMHMHTDACGIQNKELHPLELELQAVMSYPTWILGTEFSSSGRAANLMGDVTLYAECVAMTG
ncbi:hypothetical protein STEG23_015594 [Scotinomys teguina]